MNRILLILLLLVSPLVSGTQSGAQRVSPLAGSASPYLLQHLDNPVDWYPWGSEALEKAKTGNRLIMVSVGYASCHWCHVMEEESFMNEEIAALLNRDFISIKIDRESRPDLDEQFMTVTQMMTGGGGWPNTVFLTPDGDPIYATTYLPLENFRSLISSVQEAWAGDPRGVAQEAANVTRAVSGYLTQKTGAQDITPEMTAEFVTKVGSLLDPFNGGYGDAPKFPRETLFLYLLEYAQRTGDRSALTAVADMLDGMIRGGIHDHVGGGFHRYAVDPEWHVPHFEKMLYTQALTGQLLVRTWAVTGKERYRRSAERLFDYVLRDLRDPKGGFYSAQDADSYNSRGEKAEGSFYTWTPDQLAGLGEAAALVSDVFQVTESGDLEGASVLNLPANTDEIAAERDMEPSVLEERLEKALDKMLEMRAVRPAPQTDRKVVVSWNAMMIRSLAEAGYRMNRPDYFKAAEEAAVFIKRTVHGSNGLKRVSFEGKPDVPAQLADYAGLGMAYLALHDFAPQSADRQRWLRAARELADEIGSRFGAAAEGFDMTQSADGLTRIVPVNDAEIPSGNALALSLFTGLAHRSPAPELEQQAYALASAVSGHAVANPIRRGYLLKALEDLQWGETGDLRHVGGGTVRVELRETGESGEVVFDIDIAEGWHVNAHKPLDDFAIPTAVVAHGLGKLDVSYPAPVVKTLSFKGGDLALLEGAFDIVARLPQANADPKARRVLLTLQACSDQICLAPQTLQFTLW
jgi:uncharacterized protein YyaL (SSP411 family)